MNIIKSLNKKTNVLLIAMAMVAIMASCKKDEDKHQPPDLEFKTGAGYTSADATVGQGDTIVVGIIADKTEDELKTFNVSYAFDGATSTNSYQNETLTATQDEHYEIDVTFDTRNQAGTEKWSFTITDRDGNITTKSITLTVQ